MAAGVPTYKVMHAHIHAQVSGARVVADGCARGTPGAPQQQRRAGAGAARRLQSRVNHVIDPAARRSGMFSGRGPRVGHPSLSVREMLLLPLLLPLLLLLVLGTTVAVPVAGHATLAATLLADPAATPKYEMVFDPAPVPARAHPPPPADGAVPAVRVASPSPRTRTLAEGRRHRAREGLRHRHPHTPRARHM
jgi:hypothetical protein